MAGGDLAGRKKDRTKALEKGRKEKERPRRSTEEETARGTTTSGRTTKRSPQRRPEEEGRKFHTGNSEEQWSELRRLWAEVFL